jgi:hypothetical protein
MSYDLGEGQRSSVCVEATFDDFEIGCDGAEVVVRGLVGQVA